MQLVEGLFIAERFRLIRELGRGGMGSVWLAEHTGLEVLCAIKFIDRDGQNSPEVRQRFQREAKAAAQLRSPHVVQVLDHGVWEGIPYIAMEYLDGEDLAHRLERVGRLSWGETCRITTDVARALAKAHAASIVHRDMKPENIFLTRDDEHEIAKVLDFGIAKSSKTNLSDVGTKTGSLLGTPFYMSPEQARGTKSVDYRSDLFSLAVIVYQCMTGELPFFSEGLGDILAQIMYEPLPVPSQKASDIPPAFDDWWARASAREPEQRFQSAKELAESLAVALRVGGSSDIPALPPRISMASSPDLGSAVSSSKLRVPTGPTLGLNATTEEPFARTFEPVASGRVKRKKNTLLVGAGAGALALVGAFLLLRGGASSRPTSAPEPAPSRLAASPAITMSPAASLSPAAAPEAPHLETAGVASTSARPASPASPAHKTKTARPAVPGHRDYGI